MNSNKAFEIFAEKFYKKFGYLPAGKDDPARPSVERVLGDLGTTYCELLASEDSSPVAVHTCTSCACSDKKETEDPCKPCIAKTNMVDWRAAPCK